MICVKSGTDWTMFCVRSASSGKSGIWNICVCESNQFFSNKSEIICSLSCAVNGLSGVLYLSDEPIPMMSFVISWENACWIASKCQLWGGWIRAIRRPVVMVLLISIELYSSF